MIAMPEPDRAVLGRRAEIIQALRRLVPGEGVIDHEHELRAFESDGLTAYRQPPMVAVLPQTTAQVVEVMRYCLANKIKIVPRGAGTSPIAAPGAVAFKRLGSARCRYATTPAETTISANPAMVRWPIIMAGMETLSGYGQ